MLSHRVERKLVKGRYQTKVIKESFQYVSILQTLRALLLNPEVLDQVGELEVQSESEGLILYFSCSSPRHFLMAIQ